ncbi:MULTISPECIES: hypothetical protein [unclassified Gordonia (in: high G+C Gram-positive bacteria)]|uniref:hypothetical protein n=1 Tax=unclassified Gordonia (in: high G+C Gram-positive bacteria) TaxID=2657482 RepID=UPI00083B658C|nr:MULTISPECIES: hypothetical protein [unclassified Gordonia (in: high G+C Gram-positive bacteria)]OCW84657.1 hypothetical protein A8M60_09705 [Nocardia farcinica]WGJ86391.1 hypothetical protein QAD21_04210 [Gordonia sp. SMJS1]
MSVPARRSRPAELAAGLSMAAMMMLAIGACSSDDAAPAPSPDRAVPTTSATETSSPATSADSSRASASPSRGSESGSDTGSGSASTMTCTEFRELDDARRAAVLTDLDVTDNVQQVATVAATVCLTRPDDTIAAVVAELLPR